MKLVLLIVQFVALSSAMASDYYVAQTAQGNGNGKDARDAYPITWINTQANWNNGPGTINPGDTVHLTGAFTSALSLLGSGLSGSNITIRFEPGANFSSPVWPVTGAIVANNNSYMVIDGGSNGIIQNTANGTTLANQQNSAGIAGAGLFHFTVQNLTLTNFYVRTPGSNDLNRYGYPIELQGSYLTVQNNTCTDADTLIALETLAVDSGNDVVTSNTCTRCNHAILFNMGAPSVSASNVTISNNTLSGFDVWDGASAHHLDGIIWTDENPPRGNVTNVYIYGNKVEQKAMIFTTSACFVDTYYNSQITNLQIYNNLFTSINGGKWSDGPISIGGASNVLVANNTSYVDTPYSSGGPGGWGIVMAGNSTAGSVPQNMTIENNIAVNCTFGIYFGGAPVGALAASNLVVDHNAYYNFVNVGSTFVVPGNRQLAPSDWQALGYDINSSMGGLPSLDANYVPLSTDSVVNGKGVNLSNYFTTDLRGPGYPRPAAGNSNWSIGAFEPGSVPTSSPTPSPAPTPTASPGPAQVNGVKVVHSPSP